MRAQDGGAMAGRTRNDIEKKSGKPVVSAENFKGLTGKGRKKLTQVAQDRKIERNVPLPSWQHWSCGSFMRTGACMQKEVVF